MNPGVNIGHRSDTCRSFWSIVYLHLSSAGHFLRLVLSHAVITITRGLTVGIFEKVLPNSNKNQLNGEKKKKKESQNRDGNSLNEVWRTCACQTWWHAAGCSNADVPALVPIIHDHLLDDGVTPPPSDELWVFELTPVCHFHHVVWTFNGNPQDLCFPNGFKSPLNGNVPVNSAGHLLSLPPPLAWIPTRLFVT